MVNQQLGLKEQAEAGYMWSEKFARSALTVAKRNDARRQGETIWHEIVNGKLGFDLFLILFTVLGLVALPLGFYQMNIRKKQLIMESRTLTPQQIIEMEDESD